MGSQGTHSLASSSAVSNDTFQVLPTVKEGNVVGVVLGRIAFHATVALWNALVGDSFG